MKKYKLIDDNTIFDTEKNWFIPADEGNIQYQEYLEWLAAGNIPDPKDPV